MDQINEFKGYLNSDYKVEFGGIKCPQIVEFEDLADCSKMLNECKNEYGGIDGAYVLPAALDLTLYFEGNNTINALIATMFQCFKERLENQNISSNEVIKRKLLLIFDRTFKATDLIFNSNRTCVGGETIEMLSATATATSILDLFKELIDTFLTYMDQEGKKLIVVANNSDMHKTGLNQLKKYASVTNLIILAEV